ncbi:MAG: hypothetical protein ND866_31815, partial [Pyrinomonadaceae bacterium]|nr:hypothetical protein [Pyrinomonadaceae bacterium]
LQHFSGLMVGLKNKMRQQNTLNSSWLAQTKQSWKVWIFFLLMMLVLSLFVLFVWRVNNRHATSSLIPDEIALSLSFVMLGILSLGWFWLSVKCPKCRKSVAGHIMKTAPASTWLTTLIALKECPACVAVNPILS